MADTLSDTRGPMARENLPAARVRCMDRIAEAAREMDHARYSAARGDTQGVLERIRVIEHELYMAKMEAKHFDG